MSGQPTSAVVHVDAYTGPELAMRALASAEVKARLAFLPTLILGIMAGAYIGFGANFFTLVTTGNEIGFGLGRLLGSLAFCLGLILVVVGGAELFTGNTLIFMAWLSRRVGTLQLLRNWGIVYLGNLVGSLGLVLLVFLSEQHALGDYRVGANMASIADAKVNLPWMVVLYRGILCNALVCLAVWLCYSARTTTDRILSIIFPISAFVAGGFEHSIANMYFIPLGILAALDERVIHALGAAPEGLTWGAFVMRNLIPCTLGNIIGGAIMVGAVYWVAYLLPEHRREAREQRQQEECERRDQT